MNATKTFELAYVVDSHESAAFDSDYERIDWREDHDLDFVGEYESLEAAMQAADDNGIGIYYVGDGDAGQYSGAVRVVHGAKAEYRPFTAM